MIIISGVLGVFFILLDHCLGRYLFLSIVNLLMGALGEWDDGVGLSFGFLLGSLLWLWNCI